MIKLQDEFAQGETSFTETLRRHWEKPTGFVPQHDQAHVVLARQNFKTGRDVIEARKARK